jgi:glycosyltransferase involved in cell wall biosynthesis
VLHVQWALLPWLDARFWRRWRARGWTIVYTAHDVRGLAGTTPRPLRPGNRRLLRVADRVVVHSSRDRDRVIDSGVPRERIHVIAQGGPGVFQAPLVDRREARRALGIDPARPTVLLFGFLKAYKGLGLMLESLERVRDRIPDVLLLIAGEPMTSTRHWDRVIRDQQLERHIMWHRSYVPTDRVSTYFSAADVVALPYVSASSSAVLVNAFAHARPVVATNVDATSEMVIDNETGILAPAQDSAGFAAALVSMLSQPVMSASMGHAAQECARRRHGWPCIASETAALYRAAIEGAKTAR